MKSQKIAVASLLIVTAAVYARTAGFHFVSVDDPQYVVNNPHIQAGLTLDSVRWALTSIYAANWHPLTWLSHLMDVKMYGMAPGGHHVTNIILHVANTGLLCWVLHRYTGEFWKSIVVAAFFALHPLHVESVAWISERKDVLSTVLFLLTLLAYRWYTLCPSVLRYGMIILCYTMGLMAKPMLVTLPFLLILLDYWPLKRINSDRQHKDQQEYLLFPKVPLSRLLVEKLPLLVLSILSSIITIHAQREGGALPTTAILPPLQRVADVFTDYLWYLWKLLYPTRLAFFYPLPSEIHIWKVAGAAGILAALTILALKQRHKAPYMVVGWLWFVGTLVPVIGIIPVGMQDTADRYSYIPSIGAGIFLVWLAADLTKKMQVNKNVSAAVTCGVLAFLSYGTWKQAGYWRNSLELGQRALKVTSRNHVAHTMVADALDDAGKPFDAMWHYEAAVRIMPSSEIAHNSLGVALVKQGELEGGIEHFEAAVRLNPRYADAYVNMGASLASRGEIEEAIKCYQEALRLEPDDQVVAGYLRQAIEETKRRQ